MTINIEDFGVLLTSHPKQQMFWMDALPCWLGAGCKVLLGYDDVNIDALPLTDLTPPITDVFCTGRPRDLGHPKGELYQMKVGGLILEALGCKLFFKGAADTVYRRHKGFEELYNLMRQEKADFVRNGTTSIFGRLEPFNKFVMSRFNPTKHVPVAESWIHHAEHNAKTQIKTVEVPRDKRMEKILGRDHLQGSYAIKNNISVRDTWKIGEIWKPV